MKFFSSVAVAAFSLLFPLATFADEAVPPDAIHTLWIVIAGAMVFLMQPGFALLESGMARAKNAVNVMMKNYMDVCVGTLLFWMLGYGLMFGSNPTGWFGTDLFAMS
ncbi:MAG: ammonium transporter, partial [Nitrosomonadales bacterium]|nr:ammonium transporter [Nitrosomonadales bacterium]